jgi:dihydropteroate synthase
MQLTCGTRLLDLCTPAIMAVLNTTPDSFSDGGLFYHQGRLQRDAALARAEALLKDGAAIIDVGGESTRPGAIAPSSQEEMDRVLPVVEAICANLDVIVSVDTSNPTLMTEACALGAGMLNDVRALTRTGALEAAAQTGLPVCLMHMQGDPSSMQAAPQYSRVEREVRDFFYDRLAACKAAGIGPERLILDPGIGFGKTDAHNLALFEHMNQFVDLGCPVLVGVSRKSMIGRLLGRELPDRLAGSLAFAAVAMLRGAKILRVHDVAATLDIIRVIDLTHSQSQWSIRRGA